MRTYFLTTEQGDQALELAGALLDVGVLPEGLSLILDESYAERVTEIGPIRQSARLEKDLVVDRSNRDLSYATTGNPEMERSSKAPLDDPKPLYESEVGGGISTASPNDDVSGIEEMDDAVDAAEEFLYPAGARDVRSNGPRSFSEIDSEAFASTAPGHDIRSSSTGVYGQDDGLSVGVFAALLPAVVPGVGIAMGDGPLADDLMAESEIGDVNLSQFLQSRGLTANEALQAEVRLSSGGGWVEVALASGEASARQIEALLERSGATRVRELSTT